MIAHPVKRQHLYSPEESEKENGQTTGVMSIHILKVFSILVFFLVYLLVVGFLHV